MKIFSTDRWPIGDEVLPLVVILTKILGLLAVPLSLHIITAYPFISCYTVYPNFYFQKYHLYAVRRLF